ncbi:hypothetical protein CTEN210_18331 [Chaetoceros tenuissimus]|uniref:Leucine-rich repeat domain-containing protein n=1 Tax=Chaetoceros tenuissimus TaxID=426638 RepID=A0AAD3DF40_9STRA|nr:hypothetical protein CTEN210_18331 [Chaetoceros tenuissimus]
MTLFYNGEILWEGYIYSGKPLVYDEEERHSWEVIIVLPGVEEIPHGTFNDCCNVETVIMSDTVRRIEHRAFQLCSSLMFVKLSTNLEYIGGWAFYFCDSLTSIFIPPSCGYIDNYAFKGCESLTMLGLPQHVQLNQGLFKGTALIKKSPIEVDEDGEYDEDDEDTVIQWIKSINNGEAYALHRASASYDPLSEIIHALVKRHGIKVMRMPNTIGITPSQYLEANTFVDISEKDIINRYILDMMGETV